MFGNEPGLLFLKIATETSQRYRTSRERMVHSDGIGTTANCELILLWAPRTSGARTGETKKDEHGLPSTSSQGPDVSISVLRAGEDLIGVRGPTAHVSDD